MSLEIFSSCLKNDIKLTTKWIPRELNKEADFLSNTVDTDNWSIDLENFETLNNRFGKLTTDRFADDKNTKLSRFNSKFYCPGTSGIDAFTYDWSNENNWLCPPVSLIGSCFRHLKLCKAKGTLLVPLWPSAYFWPIIYPNGKTMASFINDFIVLKQSFQASSSSNIFNGQSGRKFLALKIIF